jgi:hypothetical protein
MRIDVIVWEENQKNKGTDCGAVIGMIGKSEKRMRGKGEKKMKRNRDLL